MHNQDSIARRITKPVRVPKYAKIADDLRAAIMNGTLSPNNRLPSFTDMTERYKVAKHTIERAHAILEQEGLVRREQGRGIFVESPRTNRTGYIGLALPQTEDYYYSFYIREFVKGIQAKAREYNLKIALVDRHEPIRCSDVDGLIFYCNNVEAASLELPETMPRVLLMQPAACVDIANIVADDRGGSKMATQHLIELGHRRISCLFSTNYDPYSRLRMAGYRDALTEANISFDERLCFHMSEKGPENYLHASERFMKRWLAQGWRDLNSTAIVTANDMTALGIVKTLNDVGINVPDDVSVVGFDDAPTGVPSDLPLTTVHVPLCEIGSCGVELLWDQIEKGGHQAETRIFPVELKIGKSTAPVKPGSSLS